MCNKLFFSKKKGKAYCSRSCDIEYRKKTYDRVCLTCGKGFKAKNISHIKRGDYIYCSHECTNKKYYFNELCFSNENAESMYWLGFMFAAIKTVTERYLEIEDTKIFKIDVSEIVPSFVEATSKLLNKGKQTIYDELAIANNIDNEVKNVILNNFFMSSFFFLRSKEKTMQKKIVLLQMNYFSVAIFEMHKLAKNCPRIIICKNRLRPINCYF
jgi:hypothetical protein